MPRKKKLDAEKIPKYDKPQNLGSIRGTSTLQNYSQVIDIAKLKELYLKNGFCYRIVNEVCNDVFDNGFTITDNDPFADEVADFNDQYNVFAEVKQAFKYSYLYGYGLVALGLQDTADLNKPPERVSGMDYLSSISPEQISRIMIGEDRKKPDYGEITGAVFKGSTSGGSTQVIDASRFVPMIFDPFNNNPLGYSQVTPAYNYLETLENLIWSVGQTYYRYASPLHQVTIDGAKEDQLKRIDESLADINALTRYVTNERTKVDIFNQNLADPRPFFEVILGAVCSAMSIPRQIVEGTSAGALTGSETNMKNYYSVISSYQTLLVEPVLREIYAKAMEYGLLKKTENYTIEWNTLFEEPEKDAALTQLAYSQALLNYVQAGADKEIIKKNMPSLELDSFFPDASKESRKAREARLKRTEDKIFAALAPIFSPKEAAKLAKDSTAPSYLSRIKKAILRKDADDDELDWEDEQEIKNKINENALLNERMFKELLPSVIEAQIAEMRASMNPTAYASLYRETYQSNFNSIAGFNEDLRADLSGILSQGIQENWTRGQLASKFGEVMDSMSEGRLRTIVRTELNQANNRARWEAARFDRKTTKVWNASSGACEECQGLDGERVPMNEAFSNGDLLPPDHPNCNCGVDYE